MAKWITLIFPLTDSEGKRHAACGPCLGGLALLKAKKGTWRLIHIKSSAPVVSLSGDYAAIRRLSEDIVGLADWEKYDTREQITAVPGLAERVRAIILSASGEDEIEAGHA